MKRKGNFEDVLIKKVKMETEEEDENLIKILKDNKITNESKERMIHLIGKNYLFDLLNEIDNFKVPILQVILENIQNYSLEDQNLIKLKCLSYLTNWNHNVRKRSLKILGYLKQDIQIFIDFLLDSDCRVREYSLQGIQEILNESHDLEMIFESLIPLLKDNYTNIKLECLELFLKMSKLNPNLKTKKNKRLVDEVYTKVCFLIRDIDISVRSRAFELLGDIENVNENYLLLGFKKMEINIDNNQDANGEYNVNLDSIDNDIIGAFILGLEDDNSQVRVSAVQSIFKNSHKSNELFKLGIYYLIDTFTDEIDRVRLLAIDNVTRLGIKFQISKDQYEVILPIFKDHSSIIRHSIYHLLRYTIIEDKNYLKDLINELLNNILKFPQDKQNIYKTLKCLGENHIKMINFLVDELLNFDKFLLNPEPKIDDIYIGKLIFIYKNTIQLPKWIYPHFEFLSIMNQDRDDLLLKYIKLIHFYQKKDLKQFYLLSTEIEEIDQPKNNELILNIKMMKKLLKIDNSIEDFCIKNNLTQPSLPWKPNIISSEYEKFEFDIISPKPNSKPIYCSCLVPYILKFECILSKTIQKDLFLKLSFPDQSFIYYPLKMEKMIYKKIELILDPWNAASNIELTLLCQLDKENEIELSKIPILIFPQ